ncbi:hypothetical protein [Natronoarchaeum mannanilyticum]|uniref:Uncharacterized protein n=2 Tax=Natronoarchaeum mannanilyticum TaxID=926360 RepID=A0AAV3T797_9EURY
MDWKKLAAIGAALIVGAIVVGTVEGTVIDRLGAPDAYGAATTAAYVAAVLATLTAFTGYDAVGSAQYRDASVRRRAIDVGVAAVAAGLVAVPAAFLALAIGVGTIDGGVGPLAFSFGPEGVALVVGVLAGVVGLDRRIRDANERTRPDRA